MSDIRFIQAQGDLLQAAITRSFGRRSRAGLDRLRAVVRPRRRIAAVVVALAVAGCGVAAATGAFSASTARLAAGLVNCYYSTGLDTTGPTTPGGLDGLITSLPLPAGQTPTQACRQALGASYKPAELSRIAGGVAPERDMKFIACRKDAITAYVFIATGRAGQCVQEGLTPLPLGFDAASAALHGLATRLNALYLSKNCWPPTAFVTAAREVLNRTGFASWRIVAANPTRIDPESTGTCGAFGLQTAGASLLGARKTLELGRGIPLSINRLIHSVYSRLHSQRASACLRLASARTLLHQTLAATGLKAKVAVTDNPYIGHGFSWGTAEEKRNFQRGCLDLVGLSPTYGDRTILAWFESRTGTPISRTAFSPPLKDFHA